MNDELHRILIKRGVNSPGELKDYHCHVEAGGLKEVFFGSRTRLLFPFAKCQREQLEQISKF